MTETEKSWGGAPVAETWNNTKRRATDQCGRSGDQTGGTGSHLDASLKESAKMQRMKAAASKKEAKEHPAEEDGAVRKTQATSSLQN
jgi:hypothetical protein